VAKVILAHLKRAGLPASAVSFDRAHKQSPFPTGDTGNLIIKLPGTVRRPRRMFSAHMDTVPLCVGAKPIRRGGKIVSANPQTGIGGDDRSGVAVLLNTLLAILRHKLPHPPLTFLWTVQEEIGLYGARYGDLAKLGNPAMAFNYDGSDGLVLGATGAYRVDIEITGIASHAGSWPEKGVSATTIAGLAIADLHKNGWLGHVRKGSKSGTANIGIINAGAATNVVCPQATIRAEVRSPDPAFRRRMLEAHRKAFERASRAIKNDKGKTGRLDFRARLEYEAFRLKEKQPVVAAVDAAARSLGMKLEKKVITAGLDANWLVARGIPTVTLGTGNRDPHTTAENLTIADYLDACQLTLRLATDVS
jgi:tripeptide aminopeptidase